MACLDGVLAVFRQVLASRGPFWVRHELFSPSALVNGYFAPWAPLALGTWPLHGFRVHVSYAMSSFTP